MGANLPTVDLGPGHTAKAITTGNAHTCAILDDDTLKCWGRNTESELGLGDTANRGDGPGEMGANLPTVDLGPGRTTKAITAGESHTCALLDDDTVKSEEEVLEVVHAARAESEITYVHFNTGHYDGDTYLDILEPYIARIKKETEINRVIIEKAKIQPE